MVQVEGFLGHTCEQLQCNVPLAGEEEMIGQETNFKKIRTILVVGAGPIGSDTLRVDRETKAIRDGIQRAKYRELFIIEVVLAARLEDFRRSVLGYRPEILHFCGHGHEDGSLFFEDVFGNPKGVNPESLEGFILLLGREVECVLLNACHSASLAEALSRHVGHTIGVAGGIRDFCALEYTKGFYDALGAGFSFESAHEAGRLSVEGKGLGGSDLPILFSLPGASSGAITKDSQGRMQGLSMSGSDSRLLGQVVTSGGLIPVGGGNRRRLGEVAIHAGHQLVIGRMAGGTLSSGALARVSDSGARRVHWGAKLDDLMLSQIVVRCSCLWSNGHFSLKFENVTDYSLRAVSVVVQLSRERHFLLRPGDSQMMSLTSKTRLVFFLENKQGLELTSIVFDMLPGEAAGIPVLMTERPFWWRAAPREAKLKIAAGVWIPLNLDKLEEYLVASGRSIEVFLPGLDAWLVIFYDWSRRGLLVKTM